MKPQDFFIGVIEFFSVILPGAALTYILKNIPNDQVLNHIYKDLQGSEGWIVFIFISYLLGHFLFLIGSWLDDYVYDPIRKRTDKEQIMRLLTGRKLSPKIIRGLARLFYKKNADSARDRVIPIKERYFKSIGASDSVNAFQWCKVKLSVEHPEGLVRVNRFEADSKFFRSFIPLLFGCSVTALFYYEWLIAVILMILLWLGFWRYMEQRFKSTQQAYWSVLTLEANKKDLQARRKESSSSKAMKMSIQLTHAGGVVFKQKSSHTLYLLIQSKKDPNLWVLPKGHIEVGEDPPFTAIREVREETGVWARIKQDLKIIEYTLENKLVRVQFYLMEAVEEGKSEDRLRKHEWLPLDKALDRLIHKQNQKLLKIAEEIRNI